MKKNILTSLTVAASLSCLPALSAVAQVEREQNFNGLYAGAGISLQRIFGGARVSGVDLLQEGRRGIAQINAGWRHQFKSDFVLGAEFQFGILNGDLSYRNPATQTNIDYRNNSQFSLGLTAGYAFGDNKDWLFHAYALEAKRKYRVAIKQGIYKYHQIDQQGALSFGLGLEWKTDRGFLARTRAGFDRAKFGPQRTNIELSSPLELSFAVLHQF